jgi:hypothetical protein
MMGRVAAFGVGFGNLGKSRTLRPPIQELVALWNEKWKAAGVSAQVSRSYHKTGNFVLDLGDGGVREALQAFQLVTPEDRFAVFDWEPFERWVAMVGAAAKTPPPPVQGRRWTPGMVMSVELEGRTPPEPPAPKTARRWLFGAQAAPRLRMAWKHDLLQPGTDILDPRRREGGWGAVAKAMQDHAGGEWTARAYSSVAGLIGEVDLASQPKPATSVDQMAVSGPSSRAPAAKQQASPEPEDVDGSDQKADLVVIAVRREAERIAREVCQRGGLATAGMTFANLIHAAQDQRALSQRCIALLQAVRHLGNAAAHPEKGRTFGREESAIAETLLRVIKSAAHDKPGADRA